MSDKASRSARLTRSSTPWMVALTRPSSTTGQAVLMKRASDVPPPVESDGVRPVTSRTAAATRSVNGPGLVRKATALVGSRASVARSPSSAAASRRNFGGERFGGPEIVETDVELEPRLARNDVEGRIADVDRDHFEIRGLEIRISFVERRLEERGHHRRERPKRI